MVKSFKTPTMKTADLSSFMAGNDVGYCVKHLSLKLLCVLQSHQASILYHRVRGFVLLLHGSDGKKSTKNNRITKQNKKQRSNLIFCWGTWGSHLLTQYKAEDITFYIMCFKIAEKNCTKPGLEVD